MRVHAVAPTEVATIAAALITTELHAAVAARGHATLALSGGATSAAMLTELASMALAWEHIHLFQVDERVAADGSSERNLSTLRTNLLDAVPIPADNIHPMPVTDPDLNLAALRYTQLLRIHAGALPRLDVVHLGLGADGHTASLAPGGTATKVSDRDVVTTASYRSYRRMTMTSAVLSRARWVLWLVAGGEKARVVRQLVTGDESIPAGRVRPERSVLVADFDAAALLGSVTNR